MIEPKKKVWIEARGESRLASTCSRTARDGKASRRPSGQPSWRWPRSFRAQPGGAVCRRAVQPGDPRLPFSRQQTSEGRQAHRWQKTEKERLARPRRDLEEIFISFYLFFTYGRLAPNTDDNRNSEINYRSVNLFVHRKRWNWWGACSAGEWRRRGGELNDDRHFANSAFEQNISRCY